MVIPLPISPNAGGPSVLGAELGSKEGSIGARVTPGMAMLEAEASTRRVSTTGTGGFRIKGIKTFGGSSRNGKASG
jgi:hypothetical protein